jgi:hypothetical protein
VREELLRVLDLVLDLDEALRPVEDRVGQRDRQEHEHEEDEAVPGELTAADAIHAVLP